MSEEKQIEQTIGWYKVVFAILSAIDISLFAWFVRYYETENRGLLILCFIGIIVTTATILIINRNVFKFLDRLREL